MGRWFASAAIAALVGACGSFDGMGPVDPGREVLGVSVSQAGTTASADPKSVAALDWKANQLCALGYDVVKEDVEPAANDMHLVDWQLRCSPYQLSVFGVSLANRVPTLPSFSW